MALTQTQNIKNRIKVPVPITVYNCRVCLFEARNIPIFGDDQHPDISKLVAFFGGVHVHDDDKFPKYICEDCFQKLQGAIIFRKSARQVENQLKCLRKQKGIVPDVESLEIKTEEELFASKIDEENLNNTSDNDFISIKVINDKLCSIKNEPLLNDSELPLYSEDSLENDDNESVMLIIAKPDENKKSLNCKLSKVKHKRICSNSLNPITHSASKKSPKNLKTKHPKDNKCDLCNRLFTKLHYARHMKSKHQTEVETTRSVSKRECPICNKIMHPHAISRHLRSVHGDGRPKKECTICKKLICQDFYRLHMKRHENETKNFVCDQCGQKFYYASTFHSHRLIHSNDMPYKCDYCPYRGRTKGLLKTHIRTHTGDYPYKCTQCDRRCLTKSNLNAHMRRHRGPVDFICDICSRGFYNKPALERHISVNHLGIKNYVCNTCGMAFGYRHGLTAHQVNVHKRAKGLGKPKAVYLKLKEQGLLAPLPNKDSSK